MPWLGRRRKEMKEFELQCTACKNRCEMKVVVEEKKILELYGNGCMRGYAKAMEFLEEKEINVEER